MALCVALAGVGNPLQAQPTPPPRTSETTAAGERNPSPRAEVLGLFEEGRYARVVELCTAQSAAGLPPDAEAFYLYYEGAAHLRLAQPARALTVWNRLRETHPDNAFARRALLGLGLAHAGLGEWAQCQVECDRYLAAAGQDGTAAVAAYWAAEARARQRAWASAAEAFRQAIWYGEEHAFGIESRVGLIACLAVLGRVGAAEAEVRQLAEVAPGHPEYGRSWLRVAQAARNLGNIEAMTAAARAAVDADPALGVSANLILAEAKLLQRQHDAARAILRPLLGERPEPHARGRLLADLAWVAFGQEEYTRAVALYEEARAVDPAALGAHAQLRLGLSHFFLGNRADALTVLSSLQGEPALGEQGDTVNSLLTIISMDWGETATARSLLRTGLAEWPASPHTAWRHEWLARIAMEAEQWRSAAEGYRAAASATDHEPSAATLRLLASWAEARAGRWVAVRRELETFEPHALPRAYAPMYHGLLGDSAVAARWWRAAAQHYRDAARAAPDTVLASRYVVRAARAGAILGDRRWLAEHARETSPGAATSEVWELLALLHDKHGEDEAARETRRVAARFDTPMGRRARLELGWDSLANGRLTEAVRYLRNDGRDAALAPWFRYGLATAHYKQGAYRLAAGEFLRLAEEFSEHPIAPDSMLRVGAAFNAAGVWREADSIYSTMVQQAMTRDVRRAALLGLGWTLGERGFHEEATQAFQEALQLRDNDAHAIQVLLWLGHTNYQAGRYAAASSVWGRVVALEPPEPQRALAEYWLGRSLMHQGHYVAAAATFASCRLRPGSASYAPLVGYWELRCAEELGDAAAVLANARALRNAFPQTRTWPEIDMAVGNAHRARGEWELALQAYDSVAARDAGSLGAQGIIAGAACLEALGRTDDAVVRLFRVRPGERQQEIVAQARLILGQTLLRAERRDEARQIFVDLVRHYPEAPAAATAQDTLERLHAGAS